MYNNKWNNKQHHEYDSKNNPTFSSTLLDKINKSLKNNNNNNNNPKIDLEDDLGFFRGAKKERISTLRRSSFVEKWMMDGGQTKIVAKVSSPPQVTKKYHKNDTTLLREFDVHDTLFFGPTSTSSSSSEAEYNYSARPRQELPRATCFKAPSIPKPVRTRPPQVVVESKFLEQLEEKNINVKRSSSKALKIYSNLKSLNLKQPVSPGVKLTSFINSLFAKNDTAKKDNKNNNNNNKINKNKDSKVKPTSYSACTTPTSYSRSCLSNKNTDNDNDNHKKTTNKKFQDDHHGMMMMNKRTVRFCPTSVILDEESRPCGQKSVFEDHTYNNNKKKVSSSKFEKSKKYEEMKNNKKVEEVAYDLLSGYSWESRTSSKKTNNNKNDSEISKSRVNEGDYGGNYGVNYVNRGVNDCDYEDNDDDDDDGLSCTSSDLFELDNLNLIGNDEELPVYQTTRFHPKLL